MSSFFNKKSVNRLTDIYQLHRKGIWIGVAVAALGLWLLKPDDSETRIIFQKEPSLNFKGAEILGNQRQSILRGEEALFSKTQKTVLASESELKTQLTALQAKVSLLEIQAHPSPVPSVMASGSVVPGQASGELYGPWATGLSAPVPSLGAPAPGVVGTQVSSTPISGVKDTIRLQQAAPLPLRSTDVRDAREGGRFNLGSNTQTVHSKPGPSMISFPVKSTGKSFLKKPEITLPSGSYVKATLLTGVEAPEGKSYPVLLQLDFAYIIPSDKKLDLAGCFIIAKAQGDLSTERVQMQATKLSCVSKRGGMFEREVNGFIADDVDNSFAVIGSVNTKQDRVAATAFLSSIVAGIGKAIQQAQTTSQVTPLGGSQTVLTGDQSKFIAAGGASDAASMVTQWYLKQAQSLLPTINVGSGQSVWVIMQDQVELPKDYFTQNGSGGSQNASIYSYFTNILD